MRLRAGTTEAASPGGQRHEGFFAFDMNTAITKPAPQPRSKSTIPFLRAGQSVIVRCAGFDCLAYCDRNGTWRSVFGNRELPPILQFYR
jgi:hypothetical protein